MYRFFITEYVKNGQTLDGPIVIAKTFEEAITQARDFNVRLVGEIKDKIYHSIEYGDEIESRTLH